MSESSPHTPAAEARWSELLSGRNGVLSLALTGGMCLHAVNTYISTTMLPSIVADIGGQHLYAWNTTLFMLAAILSAAVSGKLLSQAGPKKAYAIGGVIFLAGSLIAAAAPDMTVMLLGRTVQGAGGGLLFSFCYGMIMLVFEERLWPRAMALLSGVYGVALLIGPAIGGIFAELLTWRLGFAILAPVTLLYLLLTSLMLPARQAQNSTTRVPLRQLLLLAVAVLVLSLAGTRPELLINLGGIAMAVICILLLAKLEARSTARLFPRGTFQLGSPLSLTLLLLALLIFCVASEIYIPFYLQVLHGQTPLLAGYVAAMMSVGWVVSEILSARFSGAAMRRTVRFGPYMILFGMLGLVLTVPAFTHTDTLMIALISLALIAVGAGVGIGWPHLSTFALKFSPAEDADIAGSALSTVQQFAIAFGAALAGIVVNLAGFNDPGQTAVADSAYWLYLCFAGVALFAMLIAARFSRYLSGQGSGPETGADFQTT
ncbi:MFS transporter [Aliamphritea hakodatensis]|uniref:MFS transporter n=1 Tax=Aliamphritea hakodatensis TaxID=2895352 RepID=UPI0022FDA9F8|nr:MFS transporter [Aliamphritea hakodatensis]